MRTLREHARSISAICGRILRPLTLPLSLLLIGAELAVSASQTVQNPSIALEGFTVSFDFDRLTSSPRPGVLVLIGALVLIGVTPWGRILQAVRKRK